MAATIARMFFAYPSEPKHIAETLEAAITEINDGGAVSVVGWKRVSVTGKTLIDEITTQILNADLFGADLTILNHNVLFELGYAIGKGHRVWISINETVDAGRRSLRKIELLLPIGHARYVNRIQFVSKFYSDQPWTDLDSQIGSDRRFHAPIRQRGASLLYLPSTLPTDSSIALSQQLESSRIFGDRTIDDPSEVPFEALEWYVEKVKRADAVVVHMLSNSDASNESHNSKCSLVSGIAHGLGKPLLMLAHSPFDTPMDYRTLLRVHDTAAECRTLIENWLHDNEEIIVERIQKTTKQFRDRKTSNDLAQLSVGETVAENESDFLDDYFLETGAYRQALNGRQAIFVGRKGSGKTANFYAVASELRRDTRNHVCVIKPISYEIAGVVRLLRQTIDRAERGYLVESLWKFLIYTELAGSVANEVDSRPGYYQPTQGEQEVLAFVKDNRTLVDLPFSLRLQKAVDDLMLVDGTATTSNQRAHISALLHDRLLAKLRAHLGAALEDRHRVAILIDNLDKAWGDRSDTELLAEMLFGLLAVAGRISDDFRVGNPRRPKANVSLAIFLRSDIFSVLQDIAREPDKITHERITWDDSELMMRVVDNRLSYSLGGISSADIWSKYFTQEVLGANARDFIGDYVLPRPRDAIYLVRESIKQAVNRGHALVEGEDIVAATHEYSLYAFEALLVEDDPRYGKLEDVLYEFSGASTVVSQETLVGIISTAGVNMDQVERYIELLLDINFLGIGNGIGGFDYPIDELRRKTALRVARQVAAKTQSREEFEVNRVFRPILQLTD